MTPTQRLYRIVECGLCIGCGLCQSVAGPSRVQVLKTRSGYLAPVVVGDLDDETVDRIYAVCPGTRVEGLPERLLDADTTIDNVWGPWRRMVRAWAADPQVRHEGSTGGLLSALCSYLLTSGRVELVLHARASTRHPTFGERHLSFTHADVMTGAGSRYGPTAPLLDVGEVLDRGQPMAFVAKPCDIAALRNLARHDQRVDRLVRYWLTPVCGGYLPPASMREFLDRVGVRQEALTAFRYRGHGCPGPTRWETAEGGGEVHYLDLWGEEESMWALPFRCKVCPDGIGEAADIAAADSWPGGSPDRVSSQTDPGVNVAVVRTASGMELLESAVRDGAITLGGDMAPDELSACQPHQVRKKYAVWGRFQGLADERQVVPETRGLRLRELAGELPAAHTERQREGTRRRVREGRTRQPRPVPDVPERV